MCCLRSPISISPPAPARRWVPPRPPPHPPWRSTPPPCPPSTLLPCPSPAPSPNPATHLTSGEQQEILVAAAASAAEDVSRVHLRACQKQALNCGAVACTTGRPHVKPLQPPHLCRAFFQVWALLCRPRQSRGSLPPPGCCSSDKPATCCGYVARAHHCCLGTSQQASHRHPPLRLLVSSNKACICRHCCLGCLGWCRFRCWSSARSGPV